MKPRLLLPAMLALLLLPRPCSAIWMHQQTETVPIGRLLTNLQQRLATNSQSLETLYQLARVHSMAYATNLSSVAVDRRSGEAVLAPPWADRGVPDRVSPGAVTSPVARAHLSNSVACYRRAVARLEAPDAKPARWLALPIRLGLAWSLEQEGRRVEAVVAYRDALQHAWKQEVDAALAIRKPGGWTWDERRTGPERPARGGLGPGVCFSEEIIGGLIPLLDATRDAREVAQLEADRKRLRAMPRAITPIVVPVTERTTLRDLVDPHAGVPFDLDGSGEIRRWGWITTNAAWLVHDPQARGQITSGLQLFGNVTFWVFWRDGYAALSVLDDDGDGELCGNELSGLSLWRDANGNGRSDPGEVTPVRMLAVEALACRADTGPDGVLSNPQGVRYRGGASRPTYDWVAPAR